MSVRGERIIYREREEEAPARRTYTTVKRYQVPEPARSVFRGDDEEVKEDKIVIRRERREEAPRDDVEYRVTERIREREREPERREEVDYRVTERITERDAPRRDVQYRVIERDNEYDRSTGSRSEYRVIERDREVIRAPSPPSPERVREYRFEREREFSPPRRVITRERDRDDVDIERYTRSTEYFQPQPIIIRESAPQPQQIIIRERERDPAPIIIREERREPHYEFVEREEVRDESRSLVKKEDPPPPATVISEKPQPQEEDYFYERRIREVDRSRRRDESHDRRSEIRPRDSASQYSSDDSYEYVRRERTYEEARSRSHSPNHRLHLAEGAAAGVGVAEILRHHRKSQGRDPGHRGRGVLGGAALGAVGAEVLSRVRSKSRRRRSRSRSSSYDSERDRRDRRDRKHRSRSRSKSKSRAQQLGSLAAVAAVGALAGYVLKNRGKNQETVIIEDDRRRSRSRRRRASVDSYDSYATAPPGPNSAMDPQHRNRRIAQAGLASAAAAGIWDRYRSKSRGGKDRSRSRIRQGVPIAAAGLGGAALAGLYEKNKASKEARKEAIIQDELGRGRRRRSRSRSVPPPGAPYPDSGRRGFDDRPMIAYGDEPIYPEADRGRGYHSDEEPGNYRRRHHGGSDSGSSPDTRRRRSRSRSRFAETAAAAGVAGVAAHELGRRRERSRQRQADQRRREDEAAAGYNDGPGYDHDPVYSPPPVGQSYLPPQNGAADAYGNQHTYPSSNYFPPPPTGEYAREGEAAPTPYAAYNPADYADNSAVNIANQAQHHANTQPYGHNYYGDSEANLGAPYPNDTFAGDSRFAAPHDGRAAGVPAADGRNPENVSNIAIDRERRHDDHDVSSTVAPAATPAAGHVSQDADGIGEPLRSRSQSRVRFDLDNNTAHSPQVSRPSTQSTRDDERSYSDSELATERRRRRRHRRQRDDDPDLMHDQYERPPRGRRDRNAAEDDDSDGTIELPPRFDEHGNRKETDPLADRINELLGGAGLGNLLGRVMGSGGGSEDGDDGGRSGRRRHRR